MLRTTRFRLITVSFIVLIAIACAKKSANPQEPMKPTNSAAVLFKLTLLHDGAQSGLRLYDCTYEARGKVARFQLQFKKERAMSGPVAMAPGHGSFIAVAGSDNTALLEDLKVALDAKKIPTNPGRVSQLPFDAVILSQNESRSESGVYAAHPPGNWTVTKLFFPKGGDDGEVYLNFDAAIGMAEFSMKDSDYADYVLSQLAMVL